MAHEVTLGRLIEGEQFRDAIHVAVCPVVAAQKLSPGQDIGFVDADLVRVGACDKPLGIVDPYLKKLVFPGQKFWMLLYPQTITSLRHEWTHPAFTEAAKDKAASEQWLRKFAEEIGLAYQAVLDAGHNYAQHGEYHIFHGIDTPDECSQYRKEFWEHYQVVSGESVSDEDKETTPFSCTC